MQRSFARRKCPHVATGSGVWTQRASEPNARHATSHFVSDHEAVMNGPSPSGLEQARSVSPSHSDSGGEQSSQPASSAPNPHTKVVRI